MVIEYAEEEKSLQLRFEGEIDHHSCLEMAAIADHAIKKYLPKLLVFDFEKVNFMDSAGIGMVIRKVQAGHAFWRKGRNGKCNARCKENLSHGGNF